jgi:Polyketide cyclase / dehydrase and lipid transport
LAGLVAKNWLRRNFKNSEEILSSAVDLVKGLRHRCEKRETPASQPKTEPTMSKPAPLNVTVSRVIPMEAETLYDLVSDITNMHRFSPENTEAIWLNGATGPSVGAQFKGSNQLGKAKWSTKPTVTAADRGRCFAFKVPGAAGAAWTYHFESEGDGTRVTESMSQAKASPAIIRFIQRRNGVTDRAANLFDAMTVTLDRLAASVSASPSALSAISA